ncbi:predicted protein [Postia placenta Mad-698-R]|nr:predicted protein [Postia placenta Mad-698-R]
MSTSQTALSLPSTVANSSRAQIGHPNRSRKITLATKRSDERNIRSDPETPLHLDRPRGTLALSPLAPASLKLSPIKYEEISLQTLCQSLSLRRVQVKKESQSPSLRILLSPPRQQRSPPLIGAKPLWAPIHLFSALASCPALRLSLPTLQFRLRRSSTPSTVRDAYSKLGTVFPMPLTRSQAREAASRSAAENLDSSSRTQLTPSPTIPGDFDRDEEDEIDQELQDDFDEEPIPSTAEEHTSSPELLGLTTSDYDFSTPDLFERSSSSPEPEDPIPATSNLVPPTPSSFRAHAQPPIASSSRLSVIPTSDLAPPPPLTPSNAASNSNPAPPAPTIPSTTTTSSSSPAPTTTTNMSQNTNAPLMPPRGHSTAPTFDPSEVRLLRRYFQDLEALFTRCQITDEAAKKQWAVRYPSIDVADLWETIESFIDVAKSYNDWKADVRALYPGADDTRKWSLADMDQLIGERARIGIHNAADLGCYYCDFMAITKHLIAQHRLSTIEQSRAFLRGFQPALLARLETRLHLKHPDHYTDDPYTMAEIHAAATFILHGTSSTPMTVANQATASTSNTSTTVPPGMIKTKDISMIIESLSRTIATLIQPTTHATHNHAPAPRQQAAVHIHENSGAEQTCHYCGNRGCRVGTCEFAEIDIRDGKCKHNTEGKIVLPNGSFCPRTIPGLTIRDRIYEWHRRNPAAPAAPTMLFEIDDRSTMQTFTLNTSSRIEALERDSFSFGSAGTPPVHPFANARDATYAPPNVRNFATPPKPSNDKGKEPAYKTIVPVIQPKLAEEIFQRSMKSPFVTLTPEELLSIAPDVRNKYRDAVTPKRVSTEPVASAHIVEIGADEVTAVNQLSCSGATLEPGATIVPDPYETYLKHIPHGEHPAEFTVARDSNAIRSIIALVDNKEQIECIVDPGSQIVAMSEEVCLGLNLLFDPTIQLNMQSANGEVD